MQASKNSDAFSPLELKIMNATLGTSQFVDPSSEDRGGWEGPGALSLRQIITNLDAPSVSVAQSTINLADKLGLQTTK